MKVVETINWYTVVRAAISHHVHQLPADQKNSFSGVKVLGVLDRQLGIIHPADDFVQVKSRNLLPPKIGEYHAILLGPIYKLPDELLQRSLSSHLLTGKDISTLIKINKTFRRLFSSDTVWAKVPFPFEVWRGNGSQGNEEEIWSFMRLQQGLSVMSMYRLRWHSHNTSRVKLFYGKINHIQTTSNNELLFNFLAWSANGERSRTIRKIIVVGADCAVNFMKQLHFVVPETATAFHYDRRCVPLLPHGRLIDVESSPAKSKSRKLPQDPGTRVETNRTHDMYIRRIGDERLTFCQADYGERFNYASWAALSSGTMGYILVFDLTVMATSSFKANLQAILCNLLREGRTIVPVLLFLGLEHPFESTMHDSVYVAQRLMAQHLPNCPWYIQPYNAHSAIGALREGYLAGLNWITRVILVQLTL
eukprot:gene9582-10590_t